MRRLSLVVCAFTVLVFCPVLNFAQQSPVAARILAPVDDTVLTTLRGGVPGRTHVALDLGRAPASDTLTSVRLVLSRTSQQESALEKFMAEQLDPASPNFHKWLTPQQFGQLYGPADADITTLVTWLQSQGFTVRPVAPGHTSIAFSGTVAQMEAAFHTEIHSFSDHGGEFLSNASNPKIPAALAAVVSGIAQLNTIRPRPDSIRGQSGRFDAESKRLRPMLTVGSGTSASPYFLYIVPGDAATIYDTPNGFNANFSAGTSYIGSGVTIGIGGDAVIQTSTIANYRQKFIGDSNVPTITNVTSFPATCTDATSTSCNQDEAYIDTEIAGGLAPGATIRFYTSSDLDSAIEQAINDNIVDIFSLSFGACEEDQSTFGNELVNSWWQQAASQGIAVTVSSGDSGAAGCDNDNFEYSATEGLQVSGFASTPYNIAVGGTDLAPLTSSFTTYADATNVSTSSIFRSALKYIPESTWNHSTTRDTTISANAPYMDPRGDTNIIAGGGGKSSCSTSNNTGTLTGCTSGYAKPSWQTGTGVPADGARDLPDVSLMAGNGYDDATWLICTDDTYTSGSTTITYNCATSNDSFAFSGFGGTSTSAPAFAGILALVEQKTGSRLGQAAQQLYALFNGPHASAIFHDITTGNISVPCTSGTPNCSKNTAGNYFLTGYDTGTGYDLATGLGSVDATQLIADWTSAIGAAAATVMLTPSATAITTAQSISVPVIVSGGSGTPTGTITLTGGNYNSGAISLSDGAYTFNPVTGGALGAGTDTLTVTYSGDSTYAPATATATVSVTTLTPAIIVTPSAANITTSQSLNVTVLVTGSGPSPTGTVMLTGGGYTSGKLSLSGVTQGGTQTFAIPAGSLAAGSDTLTVTYSGDSIYSTTTGSTTVTVTKSSAPLTPTVTVTPPSVSISTSESLSLIVKVTGSGPTPTGTITLSGGGYTATGQMLSGGGYTFNIAADSLAVGTDTLTASYSGDANYASGAGTTTVTVMQSVYSLTATMPAAISPGGSTSSTVTVSSSTAYIGTVMLSCALTTSPSGAATDLPACAIGSGSPIGLSVSGTNGTATVSFSTTAASSAAIPAHMAKSSWLKPGAVALASLLVFFGIPARRRGWRALLGVLALMVAFGAISACGSGSGSRGGGGNSNPGTTAGNYTFTITGAGNPAVSPAPSTTITLTVN